MPITTETAATPAYRRYVLGLLLIVYVFNFIDRQILVILQESIKADMGLSDSQLALLTGFSFVIFYVGFGIPVARWSDRSNRRNILTGSIALWSLMTAMCGMVGSYWQLVLARMGVGIGEAGGTPPAHSIISDYYPPEQRARALSIYSIGIYLGILLAFLAGGWIESYFGWRIAFIVVGLPGVLLALLVRLTLIEPVRGQSEHSSGPAESGKTQSQAQTQTQSNTFSAMRSMWALKSFRYASLGSAFNAFMAYGMMNFMPSYAIRTFDVSIAVVGTYLALIIGISGAVGSYAGGWMGDYFGSRDRRWNYWISGIGVAISTPLYVFALLTTNINLMWLAFLFGAFAQAVYLAPVIAMAHTLVGPERRALSSAFIYLVLNIIGLGMGPLMVGIISDALAPSMGVASLRWGMMSASMAGLVGGYCFYLAARHLNDDLRSQSVAV